MGTFDTSKLRNAIGKLTPKQRQYAALAAIMGCGIGALWAVFSFNGGDSKPAGSRPASSAGAAAPTNIGVMAPGQQVNPVDQWVGTAGRKLAQYENERDEQSRINRDRKDFEDRTMQRFGDLEQRLTTASQARSAPMPPPAAPAASASYPPPGALPNKLPPTLGAGVPAGTMPPGTPADGVDTLVPGLVPGLVHASMSEPGKAPQSRAKAASGARDDTASPDSLETFLPVSFTRGTLLGGLDAPTGGQSQSNPHPVLIRLPGPARATVLQADWRLAGRPRERQRPPGVHQRQSRGTGQDPHLRRAPA